MLHVPILCEEVVENLIKKTEGIYMDCTVGFGGHSEKILKKLSNKGKLLGIEMDPYALKKTNEKLSQHYKNFSLYNCSYINFPQILIENKFKKVDGFLLDLGISSYQVDSAHRGFSYSLDGPLDMRFNQIDDEIKTAKKILQTISEEKLAQIIKIYGEEKHYRRISKSIISARDSSRMDTTQDLKEAICKVIPQKNNHKSLSRVFQAIRIIVNDEINNLKKVLKKSTDHLNIGGRLAIISFHSIEDRIIKHFFKNNVIYKYSSYDIEFENQKKLKEINKKPIIPSIEEIKSNSRAKSAKLRIAERIEC